jgi:hypothetical protein
MPNPVRAGYYLSARLGGRHQQAPQQRVATRDGCASPKKAGLLAGRLARLGEAVEQQRQRQERLKLESNRAPLLTRT